MSKFSSEAIYMQKTETYLLKSIGLLVKKRSNGPNFTGVAKSLGGCILIGQCGFRCSLSCCSSSYSAKSRVHLNDEEIDSSINSTREVGITSAL